MSLILATLLLLQDKSVDRLIEQLRSEKAETVQSAFQALRESGKGVEPALIQALSDAEPRIRCRCLELLTVLKSTTALKTASKLFDVDDDEEVRLVAYHFLVALGPVSEDPFLAALKSPRPETRIQALLGLRQIRSQKALALAADLFLGDTTPDFRMTAAEVLQSLGMKAEETFLKGLNSRLPDVRMASIKALGQIGSPKALESTRSLFKGDKNPDVHRACFEIFARAGLKAEDDLILALDDDDRDLRVEAVHVLGDARSERAIPRFLGFMEGRDPRMKEAAESALAAIGPSAIEAVRKGVSSGRFTKEKAEGIESQAVRSAVERLLEAQIGDDESTGFYEGQFKALEAFGRDKALPVLIQILKDRGYAFQHAWRHERQESFQVAMKELAVMALGELGGEGELPALKAFAVDEVQSSLSLRIREETLVALHRLGETKPLEDRLRALRLTADRLLKAEGVDSKEEACDQLFSLGLLYTRLRRRQAAEKVFLELLSAIDRSSLEAARLRNAPTTYYNLACISSLRGDRAKAVDWLAKAVRSGFQDRRWIQSDKDLDAIRNEEGYRKLLEDDTLFGRTK